DQDRGCRGEARPLAAGGQPPTTTADTVVAGDLHPLPCGRAGTISWSYRLFPVSSSRWGDDGTWGEFPQGPIGFFFSGSG
ncbi:MAG: hypothetical protein ACK53L_23250, partial [Pirellulaceae bacterium]